LIRRGPHHPRRWTNILSTHTTSSTTSEPKWTVQWGILMCLVIQRFFAWCRTSSPSGAFWSRYRLRRGGVGVHGSRVLWCFLGFFYYHFSSFFMTLSDMDVIVIHLRFLAFLWHYQLFYYFIFRNLIMS